MPHVLDKFGGNKQGPDFTHVDQFEDTHGTDNKLCLR